MPPYPEPDRNRIPLNPPLLPHLLRWRGMVWVVERTPIEDIVSGEYQRRHGLVHEQTTFMGSLGNVSVYVRPEWVEAWAREKEEEETDGLEGL